MKGAMKGVIIGLVIAAIGVAVLVAALALNGWKFTRDYEMKTYTAEHINNSVKAEIMFGKLKTEYYDGDRIVIEYPDTDGFRTEISEEHGTLVFEGPVKKHWYTFTFGLNGLPETVIKLPSSIKFDTEIELNAGTVTLGGGQYRNVKVQVNAGTISFGNAECDSFSGQVNAGTFTVDDVITDTFTGEVNAGSFSVKKLDCPKINVEVNAGSMTVGIIGDKKDFDITTDVSAGSCNVTGQSGGGKKLHVEVNAGSASVSFSSDD